MAGQLTIDTLKASSGVLATQNGMTGIAKAWVFFNGVTGTITSSFNVSSITVTGTGTYSVNLTTAMPNANYSVLGTTSASIPASSANAPCISVVPNSATVLSVCTFQSQSVGNLTTMLYNSVAVFSS